jgi:hypothetical protein
LDLSSRSCEASTLRKANQMCVHSSSLSYLSHNIANQGTSVEEMKIHAISLWERSQMWSTCKGFLVSATNTEDSFLILLASRKLFPILKENQTFSCGSSHKNYFTNFNSVLLQAPVLRCAYYILHFEVQSDASGINLGSVLQRTDDNDTRPVSCR